MASLRCNVCGWGISPEGHAAHDGRCTECDARGGRKVGTENMDAWIAEQKERLEWPSDQQPSAS